MASKNDGEWDVGSEGKSRFWSSRFVCDLGAFGLHLGSVLNPFCVCQVGSNANSLRIGPKLAPSRLISKLKTFCRGIFVCHNSFWRHFGIALKSCWGILESLWGHFGVILKWLWNPFGLCSLASLCNHCGVTIGIQRFVFKKHSFSQSISMVS